MRRPFKAFTLVEILVAFGVIAVLLSLLIPSLHRLSRKTKLISCASNLRNIGVCLTGYAEDWRGQFPERAKSNNPLTYYHEGRHFHVVLEDYGMNSQTAYCPVSESDLKIYPNYMGYFYPMRFYNFITTNPAVIPIPDAGLKSPPDRIISFDLLGYIGWSRPNSHLKRGYYISEDSNVLRMNLTVEYVDLPDLAHKEESLTWKWWGGAFLVPKASFSDGF